MLTPHSHTDTHIVPFHEAAAILQSIGDGRGFKLQSMCPWLSPCHGAHTPSTRSAGSPLSLPVYTLSTLLSCSPLLSSLVSRLRGVDDNDLVFTHWNKLHIHLQSTVSFALSSQFCRINSIFLFSIMRPTVLADCLRVTLLVSVSSCIPSVKQDNIVLAVLFYLSARSVRHNCYCLHTLTHSDMRMEPARPHSHRHTHTDTHTDRQRERER